MSQMEETEETEKKNETSTAEATWMSNKNFST